MSKVTKKTGVLSATVYQNWLRAYLAECGGWATVEAVHKACRQHRRGGDNNIQ